MPKRPLSPEVRCAELAKPCILDPLEFLTCLRKERRGAAVGPGGSGSTALSKPGGGESFLKHKIVTYRSDLLPLEKIISCHATTKLDLDRVQCHHVLAT